MAPEAEIYTCLSSSAASSAFPLLEVFNKPGASGKRAVLETPVVEGAREESRLLPHPLPMFCLEQFPMGAEQVCEGAQLGPALERSQELLCPSEAWAREEDAGTWYHRYLKVGC